jgi:phosphoenolpyruvate-protein phosphotransferase (PTS system enzyme I)
MSFQVFGLAVARGIAIGRAVLVASSRVDVAHYFIDATQVESEWLRLKVARDRVADSLTILQRDLPADAPGELSALLDVHLMLLHDETLAEATRHWIEVRHYNAEWALSAQLEVLARQFDEMEDEYLRDRKADLEQVVERMLQALANESAGLPTVVVPPRDFAGEDPLVLVANDISPADMLQFKGGVFHGFVTDVGGRNSHTAIVARSLDIPAVVGAREASRLIRQDDWIIIDGESGVVLVDPSPIVLEEYRFRQRQSQLDRGRLGRLKHRAAATLDGEHVELLANIELPGDAMAAVEAGAEGVGLFRSEFLFMNRGGQLPDEEEQYMAYRAAVEAMGGLPVTVRTVDIGADKPIDRMSVHELRHEHTLNPAMGMRAIRWSLSEPEMFRAQLRAILRASAHGPIDILIPMLVHVREITASLAEIQAAKDDLRAAGAPLGTVRIGAMIEVPAAALITKTFLRYFDFVSIGTNDLIQYALAIDRSDESVASLYDPWHPAVLSLIHLTIQEARVAGKGVCVCGEMAGDPEFTSLLIGLGLRSFSMHPSQILTVKQEVLRTHAGRLRVAVEAALNSDDPRAAWTAACGN